MIVDCVSKAIAQLGDVRFRSVLLRGLGLTIALLIAMAALAGWLAGWLTPDTISLPWIGEIGFVDTLASIGGVITVLGLSVFLMVPVASAFTGIFLDEIADAVEEVHYPALGPAPRVGFATALIDTLSFLGVLIGANLLALVLYLIFIPLAPLIFWALNGYLLGREYFQLVAMRRLGRAGAKRMRRANATVIWALGLVMAVPLSVPILNLLVPILGVAAFTHLYHILATKRGTGAA